MKRRRATEGLNLAFLDIMSCGLGAIILVFMLVKRNAETAPVETTLLETQLNELQQKRASLTAQLQNRVRSNSKTITDIAETEKKLKNRKANLKTKQAKTKSLEQQKQALEKTLKNTKIPKKQDTVEVKGTGEVDYLIGLKVEGPRIAIVLDASASMTDDRVIDVILRKNSNAKTKQNGPKWKRSIRVVKWLLARLPETSQVAVVAYNTSAIKLGPVGWGNAGDKNGLKSVVDDLEKLVPTGPTNLQSGLKAIQKLRPSNVYLITDGLPTAGDGSYKSLNPFSDCSALWSGSSKISGICRLRLFLNTVNQVPISGAKNNVILLPIDGDPRAADAYWQWTNMSGGIVISPDLSWP